LLKALKPLSPDNARQARLDGFLLAASSSSAEAI
jgi:hypothetical protein